MIDLSISPLLQKYGTTTLKETSKDDHEEPVTYVTSSEYPAINFDKVKEEYTAQMALKEVPSSNDALFICKDGVPVFVEFKGGYIDNRKIHSLRKKIYDSLLIFCDILSVNIKDTRKDMEYILVYRGDRNPDVVNDGPEVENASLVVPAPHFDAFGKSVAKLAKKEHIQFGLSKFKEYCFKDVHTYTQEEFEQYLAEHT